MPLASESNPAVGDHATQHTEPMLGVMTRRDPPSYMPIPPGAHIGVITDPQHPDTMIRWKLVSVSKCGKYITLACDCTVPGCNRTARYVARYAGVHPSRER